MSQWEFCSPARLFCTTWMASCKGPIGLEYNKSSVRDSRANRTRPQGVCGERKKKTAVRFPCNDFVLTRGFKNEGTKVRNCAAILSQLNAPTDGEFITVARENQKWLVGNITWQLVNNIHQNLVNGNCLWLEEAGNSNEFNVCGTDSPVFLASFASLTLRFQLLFDCSVPTWIRKITDCFAVYKRLGGKWLGTVIVRLTIVLNG